MHSSQDSTLHYLEFSFHGSKVNLSLFVLHQGSFIIFFLIYVDDILVTRLSSLAVEFIIKLLHANFSIKDIGTQITFMEV